jgi:hypothetical protein
VHLGNYNKALPFVCPSNFYYSLEGQNLPKNNSHAFYITESVQQNQYSINITVLEKVFENMLKKTPKYAYY